MPWVLNLHRHRGIASLNFQIQYLHAANCNKENFLKKVDLHQTGKANVTQYQTQQQIQAVECGLNIEIMLVNNPAAK